MNAFSMARDAIELLRELLACAERVEQKLDILIQEGRERAHAHAE